MPCNSKSADTRRDSRTTSNRIWSAWSDAEGQDHACLLRLVVVIAADSWYEAGFHLVSGLDNAAILAYPFVLAQLGWPGGVIAWVLGGVISFYCNALMCKATCTATKRFVRFRDLSYAMLGESRTAPANQSPHRFCLQMMP